MAANVRAGKRPWSTSPGHQYHGYGQRMDNPGGRPTGRDRDGSMNAVYQLLRKMFTMKINMQLSGDGSWRAGQASELLLKSQRSLVESKFESSSTRDLHLLVHRSSGLASCERRQKERGMVQYEGEYYDFRAEPLAAVWSSRGSLLKGGRGRPARFQ